MGAGLEIVAVATAALAIGCCPIAWDGPFEGRIVDAKTGEPIEGAVVAAFWTRGGPGLGHDWVEAYDGQETATDEDGRFRLPGISRINWKPLSCVEEPSFSVFARGYFGCEMIAADAEGDCGQPDIRLTAVGEAKPTVLSREYVNLGQFERFVPRMRNAILHAASTNGASPPRTKEGPPPWPTSPDSSLQR